MHVNPRQCMYTHGNACTLRAMHAISRQCIRIYGNACEFVAMHVNSWVCVAQIRAACVCRVALAILSKRRDYSRLY
eukprot:6305885-Pyramimonas_sp.AAC.1